MGIQTILEKNVIHTRQQATPTAAAWLYLFSYPQVLLNETGGICQGQAAGQSGWCLGSAPLSPSLERHPQLESAKLKSWKKAWDYLGPFGKDSGVGSPCSTAPEKCYGPHFSWEEVCGFHCGVPVHMTLSFQTYSPAYSPGIVKWRPGETML